MPKLAPAPRMAYGKRWQADKAISWDTHEEKVRILCRAGSKNATICNNNLYLDNVVKARAPHTRHRSKTALPEQVRKENSEGEQAEARAATYNCCMPTNANPRTNAMSEGPAASIM
jgi:hypothetical protein